MAINLLNRTSEFCKELNDTLLGEMLQKIKDHYHFESAVTRPNLKKKIYLCFFLPFFFKSCPTIFFLRFGSRTAGPSGGKRRRRGVGAPSWRSTACTVPWCVTRSPCRRPSSRAPRTACSSRPP